MIAISNRIVLLVASCCLFTHAPSVRAENWPQWRGPQGTGVSSEKGLPIKWDASRSLIWKCPLPEWGTSTPAIWNEAIFVTSHTADNKLVLLRIDAKTGKIAWTQEVGSGDAVREAPKRSTQKFHQLHNLASPSPVTNGETVVVHFGNGDLAAYSFDGMKVWKRNLQEDYGAYSIWWGHANSPVLYQGLVISACMQDSLAGQQAKPAESYLVAHDLRDGHVKWKTPRVTKADAEQFDAYTTPILLDVDGRRQLVVMGGNQLDAYDPLTGKQLWFLPDLMGGRTVTGPTAGQGLIYATQGMKGPLLAVKTGKTGELTYKDIAWKHKEGTPDTCCPVLWDTLLFVVADDGVARCFDAQSGLLKWRERLPGKYKASPLAVEGRIYFLNTEGLCTVVSAAPRFDKLTENQLPDETLASPAVSGGRLYIRGKTALYCLGKGL
jgi:outer membrane protein assembly factor BamB